MSRPRQMDPDRFQMKDIKRRLAGLEKELGYKLDRRITSLVALLQKDVLALLARIVAIEDDRARGKEKYEELD